MIPTIEGFQQARDILFARVESAKADVSEWFDERDGTHYASYQERFQPESMKERVAKLAELAWMVGGTMSFYSFGPDKSDCTVSIVIWHRPKKEAIQCAS